MPAHTLDFELLRKTAVREAIVAFQAAVSKYSSEEFYVFCLYTDNDVTSVYPVANTLEGLKRICAASDDEGTNYYRWAPAEWDLDFGQYEPSSHMTETNKLLYPVEHPEEENEVFGERKQRALVTLTDVLAEVRESGVFSGHSRHSKIAFWVNIGDAMDQEIEWMFQPAIAHLESTELQSIRRLFGFSAQSET
jgi:hypothetical protein